MVPLTRGHRFWPLRMMIACQTKGGFVRIYISSQVRLIVFWAEPLSTHFRRISTRPPRRGFRDTCTSIIHDGLTPYFC